MGCKNLSSVMPIDEINKQENDSQFQWNYNSLINTIKGQATRDKGKRRLKIYKDL